MARLKEKWKEQEQKPSNPEKRKTTDTRQGDVSTRQGKLPYFSELPITISDSETYSTWAEFLEAVLPEAKIRPIIRHDENLDFFKLVAGLVGASGLKKFYNYVALRAKSHCQVCDDVLLIPFYVDIWEYNQRELTCKLGKTLCVCSKCYYVHRLDLAQRKGVLDASALQLAKLNEWTKLDGSQYIYYALNLKAEWSDLIWGVTYPSDYIKKTFG